MKEILKPILILFLLINTLSAQDSYNIIKLNISSESDDFSPYMWNDDLIFTSERHPKKIIIEYVDSKRQSGVSSLFKAEKLNDSTFSSPAILSKSIQSNHHDGPASFTNDGNYIYYSRPNDIGSSSKSRRNDKNFLGIYEAKWDGSEWGDIKMLSFVDSNYIYTHPAISSKGDLIVFASNIPGGKGKADLFFSRKVAGEWTEPTALGNSINSRKDDFFPYLHFSGDLYFASNRKGDYDIYRCKVNGNSWDYPERLEAPINSEFDDYSIYLDKSGKSGYFSSNRDGVFDLYYFERPLNEELFCDSLIEESFCYDFPLINSDELEGLPLKFEWRINGEIPIPGDQLVYCFPSAGRYSVKLNIVDTNFNQVIFTREIYEFLVERVQQPYIHVADEIRIEEWVTLDAKGSHLPRMNIVEYNWNFGDGDEAKGIEVKHMYHETGQFKISLTIYGSPEDGVIPQVCSYKYITVNEDAEIDADIPYNDPLDLAAFIRMIEYEPLPDDLYYLNLLGTSDHVMMVNIHDSEERLALDNDIFSGIEDSTQIHVFQNDNQSFSYYYGATFNWKDAYANLQEAREAGFTNATIKNFKYTKLQSDDYFLSPIDDGGDNFAVVLKRTDKPIEDYKNEFKKLPEDLGDVREIYVEGEGYYYVVGNEKDLNGAFSTYSEMRFSGFNNIRVTDFKSKSVVPLFGDLAPSQKSNSYMIELFTTDDYLADSDSIFDIVKDRKLISLRLSRKKVGYYTEGGSNLIEAKAILQEMKEKGFENAIISKFEYEKLNDDGFFISKLDEGDYTYVITFDSTDVPKNVASEYNSSLLGYKVYEQYDPISNKFYYQVDVGKNLPEAVLLAKDLIKDSLSFEHLGKLRYEALNDDEFFLDPLDEGDEQYVLVLGSFKESQNVYKTFKGFSSCSEIREFYDALNEEYVYIVGGYESLEDVFIEKTKCIDMGMTDVYIQKFVYDPLDPDQFYLKTVDEEEAVFRITLTRSDNDDIADKSSSEEFDALREEGDLLDSFDEETDEFVVALGSSKSLPLALNYMGSAIEKGYNSVKVQRYIYSSMDQDRFLIRDLDKEDRYACVELFHSDSLVPPNDVLLRELSRKYPISYSYNLPTNDYVYVMGPLENKEGALKFLEMALAEGFINAKIKSMVYHTLAHDDFYLDELEDLYSEFVITILKTKNQVDTSDVYFDNVPKGWLIDEVKDKSTGYYSYMYRGIMDINAADSVFNILKLSGYPNARLEVMKYDLLIPDEFSLETLSESSEDFTVTLLRSKEKLGVDNPLFSEINKESQVFEFYNYKSKEFIYTLGKVKGMIGAFNKIEVAKRNGFDDAVIDQFVYSALNPDHFSLETIEENEAFFTIKILSGKEKKDPAYFKKLIDVGYEVREKYVRSKDEWTYSIGLTNNIAEANRILEIAKDLGFLDAEISHFNYQPLNEDEYYLTKLTDTETSFMLELDVSEKPLDLNEERFDNINGVYKVSEVYDPVDKMYKYYAGDAITSAVHAEAFRNELIAMGFDGVRISKFIYTALQVDEFYIKPMDDLVDDKFVLNEKRDYEMFVYFGFDQYFLSKRAIEKLKNYNKEHYDERFQILLEGYTDSIGDADYNMWLSRKRALSVKKYLVSMGVLEANITLVAKGETKVILLDSNKEDHKKSRRVLLRSFRKNE